MGTSNTKSKGALSAWFKSKGVEAGGWYGEAKAFTRAAVKEGFSSDAAVVLFCLRPYTVGYQSEKAIRQVKSEDGKKKFVSVTPGELAEETNLTRQKVRDALAEIEERGYGKRVAKDGGALRKGNVEIYCFTVPSRPAGSKAGFVPQPGYKVFNKIRLAAHIADIRLPNGFVPSREYKEHVEQALVEYKEATKVPQERLKQALFVAPDAPAYKEERKTLKEGPDAVSRLAVLKDNPSSSSAFSSAVPLKAEEEESDLYNIFKTEYPARSFDGAKAKPLFDRKSKGEQRHAIERLRVYKASERWREEDGRWVPYASNWLASAHSEEPPPVVTRKARTAVAGNGGESYFERRVREEREDSRG